MIIWLAEKLSGQTHSSMSYYINLDMLMNTYRWIYASVWECILNAKHMHMNTTRINIAHKNFLSPFFNPQKVKLESLQEELIHWICLREGEYGVEETNEFFLSSQETLKNFSPTAKFVTISRLTTISHLIIKRKVGKLEPASLQYLSLWDRW